MNQEPELISKRFRAMSSNLKKYIEHRLELSAIESGEYLSVFLANVAHQLSGLLIISCGLLFVLLALGIFLGDILQSTSLGLLLVSLPLFVLGGLFLKMKPQSMTDNLRKVFLGEIFRTLDEVKQKKDTEYIPTEEKDKTELNN